MFKVGINRVAERVASAGFSASLYPSAKLLRRPAGVGLKNVPKHINPRAMLAAKNLTHGRGKLIAGSIAGGMVLNGMRSRTGRAADRVRGRPTGPYQF